ncbi:hypothetical protein GDO81_001853 [Engystomops pustulosus]|uniref:Ig-like domain-containing protein n=1 Tax=Engystomops pustulosus TaxID=76066 RepID=A0AAV7DJG4_ENGPU|nr:hypothetical protein GDO81_001853 [Engystomops pustulosus]
MYLPLTMWSPASCNVCAAFSITVYYLSWRALGNVISSDTQDVEAKAGESVTLTCSYSTSSSSPLLFWYRQYPHQIQYILKQGAKGYKTYKHNNPDLKSEKFQSETSDTTTSLTISSLTASDSALYMCALSDGAQ